MSKPEADRSALTARFEELLAQFLEAEERGLQPDPQRYLDDYPELAGSLEAFFRDRAWFGREAPRLAPTPPFSTAPQQTASEAGIRSPGRTAVSPSASPWPQVPGYEIVEEIGRGGMGVVYKAVQVQADRIVALKVILAGDHANKPERERFRAEAHAVARFQHPGIVQIYEVGEHNGLPFYSMEFCGDGSLADHLDGTPLLPRDAAWLVEQIARAIHTCHERHIIHRDLKPANVLLVSGGRESVALGPGASSSPLARCGLKISDFGLAKTLEGAVGRTVSGAIVGTPSYMAPEQASGKNKQVGPATDVYTLGAILYELLTGRPPFKAATPLDTVLQVLGDEPVRPRQLQPQTSPDLERICLKCLEKEPGKRYPSALELAEDLRRFQRGEPVRARPIGRLARGWRWCKRNRAVAALLVVVGLTLTLGMMTATVLAALATARARDLAIAMGQRDTRLWEAKWSEARALRMSRQPGQRYGSLRAIREAMKLPLPEGHSLNELRTEAIAALCLPDFEVAQEWDGWPAGSTSFTIDSQFRRYARADKDGNVSVRRIEDDVELFALEGIGPSTEYDGLRFSPDGRFLHVVATAPQKRGRLWKLDRPSGTFVLDDDHQGFAFSPDSMRLVISYRDGTVLLIDPETGKAVRRFPRAVNGLLLWHPKRPEVAVASGTSLRLFNVETGRHDPVTEVMGGIDKLAWHPEGRLLAISNATDHKITIWDVQTREPVRPPMEGPKQPGVVLCFNHAGDRLLNSDWTGLWRLWDTRTGQQLLTHPARGAHLQFSPDDSLVGVDVSTPWVRLHRFASGAEFTTLSRWVAAKPGRYCEDLPRALHPNGRLLAVAAIDAVALIDLAGMEQATQLRVPGNIPLAFEPAGDALLTYGTAGLLRWPLRAGEAVGNQTIGKPTSLLSTTLTGRWGCSPDARTVAIPDSQGATVWQSGSGRSVRVGPQYDVRFCAVSPDSRWVFTGSHSVKDRTGAKVWDAVTGKHAADLLTDGGCNGWFSPDGKWLVTNGGGFRVWEVGTWQEGPSLGPPGHFTGCVFTADGKLMALGAEPGVVRLVDPATGREAARLTAPEQTRLWPHCFTPDGGKLIVVGSESQALHVFDLRALRAGLRDLGLDWSDDPLPPAAPVEPLSVTVEETKRVQDLFSFNAHVGGVTSVAFSPDGDQLASGGADRTVRVWNAETRKQIHTLEGHSDRTFSVCYSPDGKRLASVGQDQSVRIWDVQQGKEIGTLKAHTGEVNSLCFSPDGKRLASAGQDQVVRVWDVDGGKEVLSLKGHSGWINSVCFSPDGKRLASAGQDQTVRIWDAELGKPALVLRAHTDGVTSVCFSPDGKRLASASWNATVNVWDVERSKEVLSVFTLYGHTNRVRFVVFSPDGKRLASASDDLTVRVWDTELGQPVLSLWAQGGGVSSVSFSPNGKRLAGASWDGTVKIWDLAAAEPEPPPREKPER